MMNEAFMRCWSEYSLLCVAEEGYRINEDPISLQETSDILELLFRFICPPTESDNHCQPDVSELDVATFFKLAEAVEKYQVYGAINTAMIYML